MTPFLVDGTRYPLIVIRVRSRFEVTDIGPVFAEVGEQLARGTGAGLLIDLRDADAGWFPATIRRALGDALHQLRRGRSNVVVKATAIVIRGALARGVITAIWWISPPSAPAETFTNVADAEAWLLAAVKRQPEGASGSVAR